MLRLRYRATLFCWLAFASGSFGCSSSSSPGADAASGGAAGAASAPVGCAMNGGVEAYAPGVQKPGAASRFSFALLSSTPAPPALDDNSFVVQVTDADGKPAAGTLSVALDMPQHGHPSPALPEISYDAGAQAFTLDPMRLFMVGLWRITFSFVPEGASAGSIATTGDSAVFEFCID